MSEKIRKLASGPITLFQIDGGNNGNSEALYFQGRGTPKSLQMVTAAMKSKGTVLWKKSYNQPRQHIKKQRHYCTNKGPSSQSYSFSSSHVWI